MKLIPFPKSHIKNTVDDLLSGKLMVFDSDNQSTDAQFILKKWSDDMQQQIESRFYPYSPEEAHLHFSYDKYFQIVNELTQYFFENYTDSVKELLVTMGFSMQNLYWDKLVFRAVPPVDSFTEKPAWHSQVMPHRDTWGVNLYSQINLWSPLYPVEENRTIQFYPDYWHKALANSTDSWSFKSYLEEKKITPEGKKVAYPTMPQALEEPQNGVAIVVPQHQWLLFSAAHLHASVPNTSNKTRFNVEFRIVDKDDIDSQRVAPNVDNVATKRLPGIFSHILSGERLSLN